MSDELKPYKGKSGRGVKSAIPLETGDLTAIMTLAVDSCKKRCGRPANFSNDVNGLNQFVDKTIEYFQYVNRLNEDPGIEKKLIPDIENWGLYLGITRQTIFKYERRGGDWAETIAYFKNAIASVKKQLAMTYKIPPVVAIFDLTNNHQYVNASEFRLSTPANDIRPNTDIALEEKVAAAGLVWDADAGEYIENKGNDYDIGTTA